MTRAAPSSPSIEADPAGLDYEPAAEQALPVGGRVKRAALSYVSGVAYTAITLLVGFVVTPLLLKFLGQERLGAFRTMGEWAGYLSLADIGLGGAISVVLVRSWSNGDRDGAADAVRFGLRLYAKIAMVLVPIALVMGWFMPRLVPVSAGLFWELRIAAMISAVSFVFFPFLLFRSVLETAQRGYLVIAALLTQSLLIASISLLLAWKGFGLIGQSVGAVTGVVAFNLLIAFWGRRLLPPLTTPPTGKISVRSLWQLAWPLAAANIGNRLNLMTDSIVVSIMLGPSTVTILFLTQRLILLAGGQVNGLVNASWAGLAELRFKDPVAFEQRIVELGRLIIGLGMTLTGTIAAYNEAFVVQWVGHEQFGGRALTLATFGMIIAFGYLCMFSFVIDSLGHTRDRLWVSTIGSVLNLVLSIVFIHLIGVAGAALGTLCAYLLTDLWYCPLVVIRRCGIRASVLLRGTFHGLLLGLPWAVGIWIVAHSHQIRHGWFNLALELALASGGAVIYCWFLILDNHERERWKARFVRFLPAH
jgi:O-antigen/teichoic acid export membrane protein